MSILLTTENIKQQKDRLETQREFLHLSLILNPAEKDDAKKKYDELIQLYQNVLDRTAQ